MSSHVVQSSINHAAKESSLADSFIWSWSASSNQGNTCLERAFFRASCCKFSHLVVHGEFLLAVFALCASSFVFPLVSCLSRRDHQIMEEFLLLVSCLLPEDFSTFSGLVEEVGLVF